MVQVPKSLAAAQFGRPRPKTKTRPKSAEGFWKPQVEERRAALPPDDGPPASGPQPLGRPSLELLQKHALRRTGGGVLLVQKRRRRHIAPPLMRQNSAADMATSGGPSEDEDDAGHDVGSFKAHPPPMPQTARGQPQPTLQLDERGETGRSSRRGLPLQERSGSSSSSKVFKSPEVSRGEAEQQGTHSCQLQDPFNFFYGALSLIGRPLPAAISPSSRHHVST